MASSHTICTPSVDVGVVGPSLVEAVVTAVGAGAGSLLPGIWISPPKASIELEITTMAAKRMHRNLFIVLGPFGVEAVWLSDGEIVEPKNDSINATKGWRWN